MKITLKILIPIAFFLTLAVSAVSFIGYRKIASEIDKVMRVTTQATLEDIAFEYETVENNTKTLVKSLNSNYLRIAHSLAVTIQSDPVFLETRVLQNLAAEIGIDEIHIADREGILYAGSVPGFFGFDFASGDQSTPFLEILDDPDYELAQTPQTRSIDGVLFQYIGVGIPDGSGFIQIGMQPTELQELLEASNLQVIIERFHYKEGGYSYVIDPIQKTCTHHLIHDRIGADMTQFDFANTILEMENGSFIYTYEGVEVFTSFKMTHAGILITAVPTESYSKSLTPLLVSMILTSLFSLFFLMALMTVILRQIFSPMRNVSSSLRDISSGDADLTRRLKIKSRDEVGDVADSFNAFIENLQKMVSDIQEAVIQTEHIKDDMLCSTQITADSTEEINSNICSVETRLMEMNTHISDSANAMEEIASNTISFDNIISSQAGMVEESTAAITQMIASLNNVGQITANKKSSTRALMNIAEKGKKQIDTISKEFAVVVNKITSIQEMADTINSMASQTNLLSMNAAIEAAHAGEAGKGFAVVADEIRKLAETSSSSSGTITNLIKDITTGVNNTSDSVNSTIKTFDSIVQEVDSTVNAFYEIEDSVSELTVGGKQIMVSTEEINNVTSEVSNGSTEIQKGIDASNHSLMTIRETSAGVAAGVKDIFEKASRVTDAMKELQKTGEDLDRITNDLSDKFSQFTTE